MAQRRDDLSPNVFEDVNQISETESWHLLSSSESGPAARHKHSAVLHCDAMYVYGGMTDLQERNDCWRWDVNTASWCLLKSKPGPGPLHGHAACRLPSCMLIFGGESGGLATNELWRFHFGKCSEVTKPNLKRRAFGFDDYQRTQKMTGRSVTLFVRN